MAVSTELQWRRSSHLSFRDFTLLLLLVSVFSFVSCHRCRATDAVPNEAINRKSETPTEAHSKAVMLSSKRPSPGVERAEEKFSSPSSPANSYSRSRQTSASDSTLDCMQLVGVRSRTLGGPDQPLIAGLIDDRGNNHTIAATADGIVRDVFTRIDFACHLFYAQRGKAASSPNNTALDYTKSTIEDGDDEGPFLPFPRRYRAFAKPPHRQPVSPSPSFDVLLGLPEASYLSPLRDHRPLYFRAYAAVKTATEGEKHEKVDASVNKRGSSNRGGSLNVAWMIVSPGIVATQETLDSAKTWFLYTLARFPLHHPRALMRLFATRSLRVSFPVTQRQTVSFVSSSRVDEQSTHDDYHDDDEHNGMRRLSRHENVEVLTATGGDYLSRAEALSEGSLNRLRIVAYPPTVRRLRPSSSANSPPPLLPHVEKNDRLVCDFHTVLTAAAHVRDVEQELAQQRAEQARIYASRDAAVATARPDHRNGDDWDAEALTDPDDQHDTNEGGRFDSDADERDHESDVGVIGRRSSPRGGRRPHRPRRRGSPRGWKQGRLLSRFPIYSWFYERVACAAFPRLANARRGRTSYGGGFASVQTSVSLSPPPSYAHAKAYLDMVTEELGPLQPSSFSLTSDFMRYVLGRRVLFTSQRLIHVEEEKQEVEETEEDIETGAARDKHTCGGDGGGGGGCGPPLRVRRIVSEKDVFVWRASMPASESMCIALTALPLSTTAAAARGAGRNDGATPSAENDAPALLLRIREELTFDTFWLKCFLTLLIGHLLLRRPLEDSRLLTFIFAAVCGVFALLCVALLYALREIQKMSVGRMGVYLLLVAGGTTALLEALVSVGSLLLYQLLELLDAQESGVGILALLASPSSYLTSSSHSATGGGNGGDGDRAAHVLDDDDVILRESRRSAAWILAIVSATIMCVGAASSLAVRCFVSDRHLRIGARLSLRALLLGAWLFVFAVNREATTAALLVCAFTAARPWYLFRGVLAVFGVRSLLHAGGKGQRGVSSSESQEDDDVNGQRSWVLPSSSRCLSFDSEEPADNLPPEASRYVSEYRPLTAEYRECARTAVVSAAPRCGSDDGADDNDGDARGKEGEHVEGGVARRHAHVKSRRRVRMEQYDRDGSDYTRRALDDLARLIRANPEKYAGRLRDPNSVRRWAGVDSDGEAEEGTEDDAGSC